jgi:magnesium-transporting ATPase (P-type)
LIAAKDLFINQSTLTGEAMPLEKSGGGCTASSENPFDLPNTCFMGSNVLSGVATGVIVRTGAHTCFGQLADTLLGARILTAFDQGISRFTRLMLGFILVMVPAVFVINGLSEDSKHILICKGAIEEVFAVCSRYELDDETGDLDASQLAGAIIISMIGIALPYSFLATPLGFTALPAQYWFALAILVCYATLTHVVKMWFVRRWGM